MLARNKLLRSNRRLDVSPRLTSNAPIHPAEIDRQPLLSSCTPSEPRNAESLCNAPSACRFEDVRGSIPKYIPHPHPLYVDSRSSKMVIGVALGSPGHGPLPPSFSIRGTLRTNKPPVPVQDSFQFGEHDAPYSRGNRWKTTFGGLFGKKSGLCQTLSASSRYQICEPGSSAQTYKIHHQLPKPQLSSPNAKRQDSSKGSQEQALSRDWIGSDQPHSPNDRKDHKAHRKTSLRRKNVLRKEAKLVGRKAVVAESDRPKGCTVGAATSPIDGMTNTDVPRVGPQGGSLLQIQIPNVELERYSVMFSALLQSGQQSNASRQPSPKRQTSLLERRQGNLREVQTAQLPNFPCPWTRAENRPGNRADSPCKSPSFPPSPTASRGRSQSSRRERSPFQQPATTPNCNSPSKAKFDFSDSREEQDQVVSIVCSPKEQPEPQGRVISEDFFTHNFQRITTSSEDIFTTARTSPNSSPQRPADARKPAGASLQEAAEISIARQISISERQRQLLVALQPVQPKIVNVQRQGSKSPKSHHSHHLVLENA